MLLPFRRISLIFLAILAGLLLAWGVVRASPRIQPAQAFSTPMPLPNQPAVVSPDISFIDSPTAACVQPIPNTGDCYIIWEYLYAYADPNYMITMTVEIDGKARARFNGFFQTSMFVPSEMLTFRVNCGAPGLGGMPNLDLYHSYTLRARDSAGLKAANYGSVTCPTGGVQKTYFPLVLK